MNRAFHICPVVLRIDSRVRSSRREQVSLRLELERESRMLATDQATLGASNSTREESLAMDGHRARTFAVPRVDAGAYGCNTADTTVTEE